jgi:D-3-phosphoglycerate dehydrogenase
MKKRILVTDEVHREMLNGLQAMGYDVDYIPESTYEEVKKIAHQYAGLIINSKINCDSSFLDSAEKLEFIARLGSGMEIVDVDKAASRHIAVFSAPEGNALAVAEHALGMMLSLNNRLNSADREVRQGIWRRAANRGIALSGSKVGIIGFGHTGSALAGIMKGFRCNIMAYDKFAPWKINPELAESVSLDTLLRTSDVVTLHVSHPVQNHHFANEAFFDAMKPGALLINTSRGKVVDTKALLNALRKEKLRAAGLDVFENEKPETYSSEEQAVYDALYSMDQVLLTPHIAGWTEQSLLRITEVLLQKIRVWKGIH